jgi:hypothetical protein
MEDTKDTTTIEELGHSGNTSVQRDDVESASTENVSNRSTATMISRGTSSKKQSVMSLMVFRQSKSFMDRPPDDAYKEHLGDYRQYWRDIILGKYM